MQFNMYLECFRELILELIKCTMSRNYTAGGNISVKDIYIFMCGDLKSE